MAKFANPRKKFNWSIQISPDPINPFQFQKVTVPEITVEQTEHGDTNHDIKTGGRVKYGNMTCEKLSPSNESDAYLFHWIDSIQSAMLGGGIPPALYKKTITVFEYAEDGVTVLNTWFATGVWPCKINGLDLDRNSSDNTIETVEFSVDVIQKV
jgi:phage tail-like protein